MSKKLISLLISVCMLFALVGCNNIEHSSNGEHESNNEFSSEKDLYNIGLEITKIMNDMVRSEEYASFLNGDRNFPDVIDVVNTNDYDSPTSVYSIEMSNSKDLLLEKLLTDEEKAAWNNLPNNLRKQFENKISFSSIISVINGQNGSQKIHFSSSYIAFEKFESLNIKEKMIYLYVFEKGTPIVVTFSESGYAQGQFLFLNTDNNLSEIRNAFEPYQCSVQRVDI